MTRTLSFWLGAMLIIAAFAANISFAKAESVSWTSPEQPRLEYRFGNKGSWLNHFIATIRYQARVVDVNTGVVIPSGTAVGVGTQFRVEPIAHVRQDISWVGTGGRYDSPYGEWIENAENPDPTQICTAENFYDLHDDDVMYGRLSIDPPAKNISTNISGSSFSCNAQTPEGSVTCTADSPGAMNATVNFASTYGKMYLAANDWFSEGRRHTTVCDYPQGAGLAVLSSSNDAYQLDVPPQSVPFSITSTYVLGEPPTAPAVSAMMVGNPPAPSQCVAGSSFSLTIRSTDPDGQQIRYYIDWNGDGFVDQIAPSIGYVPSGTTIAISRTFSTSGDRSIRVQATDELGLSSAWTTYSFTCTDEPGVQSEEEGAGDTGGGGSVGGIVANLNLRAVPSLVRPGETTRLFWSAGAVAHCEVNGTNGDSGSGWDTLVSPVAGKVSGEINEQTTYTLSCFTFEDALITDTATVNVLPIWSED